MSIAAQYTMMLVILDDERFALRKIVTTRGNSLRHSSSLARAAARGNDRTRPPAEIMAAFVVLEDQRACLAQACRPSAASRSTAVEILTFFRLDSLIMKVITRRMEQGLQP
jgi:hypothetical protein